MAKAPPPRRAPAAQSMGIPASDAAATFLWVDLWAIALQHGIGAALCPPPRPAPRFHPTGSASCRSICSWGIFVCAEKNFYAHFFPPLKF